MSTSNQQTLADSRANERPPMLERRNYTPWESRFRRFLDNKHKEGEQMWNSIQNGPYMRPMILDPDGDVNIKGKRIENGAKTGFIGLNLVKKRISKKKTKNQAKKDKTKHGMEKHGKAKVKSKPKSKKAKLNQMVNSEKSKSTPKP
ncbi:hypothetical protein Tco_1005437 [Tanacetum coccineum]|uniref:Uncharacterized protein n=1 Tax=Tanacetum coccineum TaxID=301880 RepID=A0ABQ5FFF4_9ASTR